MVPGGCSWVVFFIRSDSRSIQVLRAIADSNTSRQGVTEVILDDTLLATSPLLSPAYSKEDFQENIWTIKTPQIVHTVTTKHSVTN